MILFIDLCYKKDSLSRDEFVAPVVNIVRQTGLDYAIRHYAEITETDVSLVDRIILCGTALKDNRFLSQPDAFCWLKDCKCPVLGICGGMEIITVVSGGSVRPKTEIGMTEIRVVRDDPLFEGKTIFEAYELHRYGILPPKSFEVIAESNSCPQAIKSVSGPVYGVMFHPEVRNEWVVRRFVHMDDT